MKKPALHWQIFIGMAAGILVGLPLYFGLFPTVSDPVSLFLGFVGKIFLRLLSMIVLPLVVSSIIVGIAKNENLRSIGRLGWKTGAYYLSTSCIAVLTGLILVNVLRPGAGAQIEMGQTGNSVASAPDSIWEILINIVPKNPIQALASFNMVSIIFFTIMFGICLNLVATHHKERLLGFFEAVFEVMMRLTRLIIALAPIGIFALIGELVVKTGFDAFKPLLLYMITVALALLFHFFITLPLVIRVLARRSPFQFLKSMSPALLTAFSTASSSATLPMTMECAEDNAGISNEVTSFVMPLGATVNMDGTALYECVAVIFIAQVLGVELSLAQQFLIVVTAVLVSIGAAGVPHAGLVMMTIIVQAVGLPLEAIGMILAVDRILDMMRTATNVWSDSVGTYVIASTEGGIRSG